MRTGTGWSPILHCPFVAYSAVSARLALFAQSSHAIVVAPIGVMQAPGSAAVDDCFDRPTVRRTTSAMATRGWHAPATLDERFATRALAAHSAVS